MRGEADVSRLEALKAALRRGATVKAAATEAGVSRTHAYKASKLDPELAELLEARRAQRGRGARAGGALDDERSAVVREAVEALRAILADPKAATRDRIAAAGRLLGWAAATPGPQPSPGPLPLPPPSPSPFARDPLSDDEQAWALETLGIPD